MITTISVCYTPQQYLDETSTFLLRNELVNNLALGIPNALPDKDKEHPDCVFINACENNEIKASSVKTIAKALVAASEAKPEHIRALVDYYRFNKIDLRGVVGESQYAEQFAKFFGGAVGQTRTLIAHELKTVNTLRLAEGRLEVAAEHDTELLCQWTRLFEEDAHTFPKQTDEQILKSVKARISGGNIFKWIVKDEIVSIAAIVRKTKNYGIVGLVYTPQKLRGRGYATSTVQKLSEHILQSGFTYCGLFTDKSNPTSNYIYKTIGYTPVSEFSDIEFG
jgi:predicted GNAT family acetyltransferase